MVDSTHTEGRRRCLTLPSARISHMRPSAAPRVPAGGHAYAGPTERLYDRVAERSGFVSSVARIIELEIT
jgi:hypothetical protein